MTESQLTRQVMKYLRTLPGCFAFKIADRFTVGIPDIYLVHEGRNVWIELKTAAGKLSEIQKWTINQIKNCGGEAYVCRTLKEVQDLLIEKDDCCLWR
jgi:hypothetical protein